MCRTAALSISKIHDANPMLQTFHISGEGLCNQTWYNYIDLTRIASNVTPVETTVITSTAINTTTLQDTDALQ